MGTILMLVLDTCALLWHTLDPDRLSPAALSAIESADRLIVAVAGLFHAGLVTCDARMLKW